MKVYGYYAHPWQRWLRPGRIPVEWNGLHEFKRLGFRCTEPVAWGAQRNVWGRLQMECLVTVAIPDAAPLIQWNESAGPERKAERRSVLRTLAKQVARLHDAGYFHRDLRWRNILIARDSNGKVEPVWLDSPRGFRARCRWRNTWHRVRDLYTLNRHAIGRCSLRERVEFLRWYLDVPPGHPAIREWGRRLDRYVRWRRMYHRR